MSQSSDPERTRPRLPFTLYVLAGLMLIKAVLLVAVLAGATLERLRSYFMLTTAPGLLNFIRDTPWAGGIILLFAALLVLSVIGMLTRRRIGWLLAMVVTGLFVALDIYGFMNNAANHIWMTLNIVTVFYLNQREVREAVGAAASLLPDATEMTA